MARRYPRPPIVIAFACALTAVTINPAVRAHTLRIISTLTGRTAAGLRRMSIATGLRYVDLVYPPVEETISRESAND